MKHWLTPLVTCQLYNWVIGEQTIHTLRKHKKKKFTVSLNIPVSSKYQNKIFQLDDVTQYKYKGYKYYINILKTQIPTCPLPAGSFGDAVAGFQSGGGGEAEEDDGGLSSYPQVMITIMMMAYLRMMIMVMMIMITTTRSLCLTQLSAMMIMMIMVIMMISYQKISTRSLRLTQLSASQEELRRYKVDINQQNQQNQRRNQLNINQQNRALAHMGRVQT